MIFIWCYYKISKIGLMLVNFFLWAQKKYLKYLKIFCFLFIFNKNRTSFLAKVSKKMSANNIWKKLILNIKTAVVIKAWMRRASSLGFCTINWVINMNSVGCWSWKKWDRTKQPKRWCVGSWHDYRLRPNRDHSVSKILQTTSSFVFVISKTE